LPASPPAPDRRPEPEPSAPSAAAASAGRARGDRAVGALGVDDRNPRACGSHGRGQVDGHDAAAAAQGDDDESRPSQDLDLRGEHAVGAGAFAATADGVARRREAHGPQRAARQRGQAGHARGLLQVRSLADRVAGAVEQQRERQGADEPAIAARIATVTGSGRPASPR
jgi:hypothetical protein